MNKRVAVGLLTIILLVCLVSILPGCGNSRKAESSNQRVSDVFTGSDGKQYIMIDGKKYLYSGEIKVGDPFAEEPKNNGTATAVVIVVLALGIFASIIIGFLVYHHKMSMGHRPLEKHELNSEEKRKEGTE